MNYLQSIKSLSKACLREKDFLLILKFIDSRDLNSIVDLAKAELKKFNKGIDIPVDLEKQADKYYQLTELLSTATTYLRLNDDEDTFITDDDEEEY